MAKKNPPAVETARDADAPVCYRWTRSGLWNGKAMRPGDVFDATGVSADKLANLVNVRKIAVCAAPSAAVK